VLLRLWRNREIAGDVILNEVTNLDLFIALKRRDPSAEFILSMSKGLRMTIRHSLVVRGR
jgi:hypothetical protein